MKRRRMSLAVAGMSATVFQVGLPLAGCESLVSDPQAFFEGNTCNFFNCDTLFFLRSDTGEDDHDEATDDHDDNDAHDSEEITRI